MSNNTKWTLNEYREWLKKQAELNKIKNKYGNQWAEVDGIKFQSKKEAEYYGIAKLLQKNGYITKFERQKVYKFQVNGILICKYIADFVLYFPNGKISVIDVKSDATKRLPLFLIKKKLMLAIYKIEIKII